MEISLLFSYIGKHAPKPLVSTYTFIFYSKELKTYVNKNTCSIMFLVSLFIIVNYSYHSSIEEWINKHWFIYTTGYYSAVKTQYTDVKQYSLFSKCCINKAFHKRVHAVWFYLHKVLEQTELFCDQIKQNSGCSLPQEIDGNKEEGNFLMWW